jgi:uncharacterized protein (DUF3820 family)
MNMPFGKHIGVPVGELPKKYLQWLVDNVNLNGKLKTEVYQILNLTPEQSQEDLLENLFN